MPRFSSVWATPSRLIGLPSAAKANLVHEPAQAVTEALHDPAVSYLAKAQKSAKPAGSSRDTTARSA